MSNSSNNDFTNIILPFFIIVLLVIGYGIYQFLDWFSTLIGTDINTAGKILYSSIIYIVFCVGLLWVAIKFLDLPKNIIGWIVVAVFSILPVFLVFPAINYKAAQIISSYGVSWWLTWKGMALWIIGFAGIGYLIKTIFFNDDY
ncbi:TPA: hypothetical protein MW168_001196 [Acinetobacter baumannii]|nr:hypothetical protein [Acinetobacter baumannii]